MPAPYRIGVAVLATLLASAACEAPASSPVDTIEAEFSHTATGAADPKASAAAALDAAVVQALPVTLAWQQKGRALATQANMNPLAAARLLAATGMAAMRAVETVDGWTSAAVESSNGRGYGSGGRSRYEARRGAVAGASARVLAGFFPAAAADLEGMVAAQGQAGPGGVHPNFTFGLAIGRAAGDEVMAHVASDGFTTPWSGTIPVGPGLWTTAVLPPGGAMLGQVRPWFMTSGSQFRPAPPPAFLSAGFNADLAQVVAIGVARTPEQIASANDWAFSGGTHMPTGYWNELAATYVAEAGSDEGEAARVFGVMGAAVFDALIAAFEAKYHYWTLRPHQADPALTTVFTVPNYPAYPSGHGSLSAAATRVLAHFYPERAAELETLRHEAAMSRVYAGIHYFFDMTAAKEMAEKVADHVIQQAGH